MILFLPFLPFTALPKAFLCSAKAALTSFGLVPALIFDLITILGFFFIPVHQKKPRAGGGGV